MRIRSVLLNVAFLASAGCGGSVASSNSNPDAAGPGTDGAGSSEAGAESGGPDGEGFESGRPDGEGVDSSGPEGTEAGQPETACGGCTCTGGPMVPSGNATPQQACTVLQDTAKAGNLSYGMGCQDFCVQLGNPRSSYYCTLPQDYTAAYYAAQPDGGEAEGGPDAGPTCPAWSSDVVITCGYQCLGRRTDGVAEAGGVPGAITGALLGERAYLEAVSVHAFSRLERELAAHGAPPSMLRAARRARRDEVRHTAMMTRLARRYGHTPRPCEPAPAWPLRDLFAIALENAVEGCVRETYGAVVGLVEARVSRDPDVRRAMRSIAADECRHAELAWEVAAWILPRLTPEQRDAVRRATAEAVAKLEREGDGAIVRMLASRLWARAPGEVRSAA
jgi:hypothetical protein